MENWEKCICENPNLCLPNFHYKNRLINLSLLEDKDRFGIIIFEGIETIAVFDNINYCPICGKVLKKEK